MPVSAPLTSVSVSAPATTLAVASAAPSIALGSSIGYGGIATLGHSIGGIATLGHGISGYRYGAPILSSSALKVIPAPNLAPLPLHSDLLQYGTGISLGTTKIISSPYKYGISKYHY